jgi:hypothetical protein
MNAQMIFVPVLVQIILTIIIYALLNVAKIKAVRNNQVDLARRGQYDDAWPESVRKINNNIRNQFEVPVLFYVLALMQFALNAVSVASVVVAWVFALSRIVHAVIHIGPNYVPYRRRVFMFGCFMLVILAGLNAYALFNPR